jgi:hypothetical protein
VTLYLVNTLPGWLLAILVIGMCIAFALVATHFGRRAMRGGARAGHNDVGGMIMQVVGGVYAVLLALVVIGLWEERSDVEQCLAQEASHLTATYRDIGGLPPEYASLARSQIEAYTSSVVTVSFPEMRQGRASEAARAAYMQMFETIRAFNPQTRHDEILFAEALRELNLSSEARTKRLTAVRGGLPPVFWAVLLATTGMTLAIGGVLSMEDRRHHMNFMVAFATAMGCLLFLVVVLDHPLSGDFGVTPDPYLEALAAMRAAR